MISCNHKTTKLFGGCVCVGVWLILNTHVFLYGNFYESYSTQLNKLSSLGRLGLGDLMLKAFV